MYDGLFGRTVRPPGGNRGITTPASVDISGMGLKDLVRIYVTLLRAITKSLYGVLYVHPSIQGPTIRNALGI